MTKIGITLVLLIGWVLVALISSAQPRAELLANGELRHLPFGVTFMENLMSYARWAILTPPIMFVLKRITIPEIPRTRRFLLHLAAASCFIVLAYALKLIDLPFTQEDHTGPRWSSFRGNLPHAAGIYGMIVAGTLAYLSHRKLLLRETQLVEARLQALSAQLHPHFLSNALNGIAALVEARPSEARSMIARLGELLRAAVDSTQHRETSLTHEIEWLERYLEVQQIRFEDRLSVSVQIAPEVVNAMVPPLILQPIVENAIKHGIESRPGGGRVTVHADRHNGSLRLRVGNDAGIRQIAPREGGVGLRNVRARLHALYGAHQSVSITQTNEWVEAVLHLPFKAMQS